MTDIASDKGVFMKQVELHGEWFSRLSGAAMVAALALMPGTLLAQGQKPAANHPWRRGLGNGKMKPPAPTR